MRLAALGLVVMLAACATEPPVNSEFDPTVDFTSFDSFRLVRPAVVVAPGAGEVDARILETIFAALGEDLRARSLTELEQGADLAVNVTVHLAEQTGVDDAAARWDASGDRLDAGTYAFTEGTLVLDFFDAATDQLVWRGWAQGAVSPTADYDLAFLAEIVHAMLARYPPGAGDD